MTENVVIRFIMEGDGRIIGQIKEKLKLPGRLPEA